MVVDLIVLFVVNVPISLRATFSLCTFVSSPKSFKLVSNSLN